MGIGRWIVAVSLSCVLAAASASGQVKVQSLLSKGSAGVGSPPPSDWHPHQDIVLYGGPPAENQILDLKKDDGSEPAPLNLGVTADVKLQRGMAAVGYAFARLDPETAAKVYRLRLGQPNENLGSRFVWLGDRGSAIKATLFLVDQATLLSAEGTDQVDAPGFMDLSVETKRALSDRIRLEAGLSKALFLRNNNDAGEFNGFTSKVNQGMTVQAGVGYVPLNNVSFNLESMYRADGDGNTSDGGRAFNLSGEWAAKDSVLLGAAFIYYDQQQDPGAGYGPATTAPSIGSPVDGKTVQFQAFFDLDASNNLVLGVKALHHGPSPNSAGYSPFPGDEQKSTIFEVSIKSDF